MMRESKSNTMMVVLGLLVVSLLLLGCLITRQQFLDIFYLLIVDIILGRYLYVKKKS